MAHHRSNDTCLCWCYHSIGDDECSRAICRNLLNGKQAHYAALNTLIASRLMWRLRWQTGAYAAYTVLLSWLPAAFPGYPRRRAVAVAFLAAFSNTANIAG